MVHVIDLIWTVLISEILVLANGYVENLALHKETWQQNPISDAAFSGAGWAVYDKYTTRKRFWGECVESEYGHKSATWRVDLGEVLSIHHITWSLHLEDTIPNPVNITCKQHGKYVIYNNSRTHPPFPNGYHEYAFNDLWEVQVYDPGCPKLGFYGPDCSFPCPQTNCRHCHPETGLCNNGYCSDGFYRQNCSLHCPDNCIFCQKRTGLCEECYPGFLCHRCLSTCEMGDYGRKCEQKCSPFCNISGLCHHVTGECDNGCIDVRQGP